MRFVFITVTVSIYKQQYPRFNNKFSFFSEPNGHVAQQPTEGPYATTVFQSVRIFCMCNNLKFSCNLMASLFLNVK